MRQPSRDLRLLHASDCHLGSGPGPTGKEDAFAALIDLAASTRVDALLIAGDLFDTPRAGDEILEWTAGQLTRAPCPVVVLPGNHDWYEDESPFLRFDFEQDCPNVHVLDEPDGELVVLADLDAAFFGRPVRDHASSFRPIADLPARPDVGWCIVMGHGLVVDSDHPTNRGSPIYPSDLAGVDWDYVALGHLGRYRQVQADPVPVVYAGDTVCSHEGRPGAVIVDLSPTRGVTPTWTPLA
jgi:DNA repair protein SbcD/Mre11